MTTTLIAGGAVVALACFAIWLAVRNARKSGVDATKREEAENAKELERRMAHEVAKPRDTSGLPERLRSDDW